MYGQSWEPQMSPSTCSDVSNAIIHDSELDNVTPVQILCSFIQMFVCTHPNSPIYLSFCIYVFMMEGEGRKRTKTILFQSCTIFHCLKPYKEYCFLSVDTYALLSKFVQHLDNNEDGIIYFSNVFLQFFLKHEHLYPTHLNFLVENII